MIELRSALTLCVVLNFTGVPLSVAAEATSESVDAEIKEFMDLNHIPGLAVAAFASGKIIWTGTYGFGNVDPPTPVTQDTLFHVASISKPVTSTILMSLYADGKFSLDDDINAYLPFAVRNPNFPEAPITFRQLLRHRSSIADNYEYYSPYWEKANGDPATVLGEYLENYLTAAGRDYSAQENFLTSGPDEVSFYCNTCYALLAYLAETISGLSFQALSEQLLFSPLGMHDSGWFLRDVDERNVAMPYRYEVENGYVPYGHGGYPDWPAGQLRVTIGDYARFLAAYVNNGTVEGGQQVIDLITVDTLSPRSPHLGFHTWFQRGLRNGEVVYMHNGADLGVRSYLLFNRLANKGVVVLTNGESAIEAIAQDVYLAIESLMDVD